MCRPVVCKTCSKTTWSGCGQHIAQVKSAVAKENWCNGKHSDAELAAARQRKAENAKSDSRPAASLMDWFRRRA